MTSAARAGPTTRFAPAPTGRLHLGHLANALYVWGLARARAGRVILRIEDHDRQRCRPEFETALLDDLDRLALAADEPSTDALRAGSSPYRQSDNGPVYEAAVTRLAAITDAYACDCSRSTFARWRNANGAAWSGPGCPGECLARRLDWRSDRGLRIALGDGDEAWDDALLGPRSGPVAPDGDLLVRDRNGNRTYALCVVVDDVRHGVDLVIRGQDLLDATPSQIRLGRLLGRPAPPTFAHHPLVRRPDGSKLSKADGATAIGSLLDEGATPSGLFGEAAFGVGLIADRRAISWPEALELASASYARRGEEVGMEQKLELLERVPLFAEVSPDVLHEIAGIAEEVEVPAETALTHEGRHEGYFFVVVSGSVGIERGGRQINTLGPGDFLGGIALLDGGPRTATARTLSPCRLLSITTEQFHDLLEQSTPVRKAILEAAGRHLRAIDEESVI